MSTFIHFLAEIAQEEVVLSPDDVQRLKQRFGPAIGKMGRWSADGSLIINADLIHEARSALGKRVLSEAARALMESTDSSSVAALIEKISELNKLRFRELCQRYQETSDPAEEDELNEELVRRVFPS